MKRLAKGSSVQPRKPEFDLTDVPVILIDDHDEITEVNGIPVAVDEDHDDTQPMMKVTP